MNPAKIFFISSLAGVIGGIVGTISVTVVGIVLLNFGGSVLVGEDWEEELIPNEAIDISEHQVREGGLYLHIHNKSEHTLGYLELRVELRQEDSLEHAQEIYLYPEIEPDARYETGEVVINEQNGEFINLKNYDSIQVRVVYASSSEDW